MLRDITFPADEKKFNEKCLLAVAGGPLSFEDRLSARLLGLRDSKDEHTSAEPKVGQPLQIPSCGSTDGIWDLENTRIRTAGLGQRKYCQRVINSPGCIYTSQIPKTC